MSETILQEAKKKGCSILDNAEVIKFKKKKYWEIDLVVDKKKKDYIF